MSVFFLKFRLVLNFQHKIIFPTINASRGAQDTSPRSTFSRRRCFATYAPWSISRVLVLEGSGLGLGLGLEGSGLGLGLGLEKKGLDHITVSFRI